MLTIRLRAAFPLIVFWLAESAAEGQGITGTYSGNYTFREDVRGCSNLAEKTYAGAMAGSLVQTGNSLTGNLGLTGAKHTDRNGSICTLRDDVGVVPITITGTVNGNAISGLFVSDDDDPAAFTATVTGDTIEGLVSWSEEEENARLNFKITRTATTLVPVVLEFRANPESIAPGQAVTLSWRTLNTTGVTIDNGVGAHPPTGSATVTPAASTTYLLTASGSGQSATATAQVNVSTSPPANVIVSVLPRGLVQAVGEAGATDTYTLTNVGGATTTVTLGQTGSFFAQTPSVFALKAGASQVVTLTATQQQSGLFTGSSTPTGNGVTGGTTIPVRMLVAARPTGTVNPRPKTSRVVVEGSGSQGGGGNAEFTNHGTAMLQAIAVSDVPWIIVGTQSITLAPGQTASVSFTVDANNRPDAGALLGATTGSLSLRFVRGTADAITGMASAPGASTGGSISITIVSVVKPGSKSGSPAALGNELALFIPGLSSKSQGSGDLIVAARSGAPAIADLSMFYTASFAGTFYQAINQPLPLPSNAAVFFPTTVQSVFGNISQTGTVQLRSSQLSKVAVAGSRVQATSSAGTYVGSLPVLRSDRGAGPGERVFLSGVATSQGIQTDLYIQEVSGNSASVLVEFLSSSGTVIGSLPTVNLGPFGFSETINAVPDNATAVRLTHTGAGAGRIGAGALVIATGSGDAWLVEEPVAAGPPADTFYVPLVSAGGGAPTTLFVTNRTSTSRTFTADLVSQQGRRRTVRTSAAGDPQGPMVQETQTHTLGASGTVAVDATKPGYARVRSEPGALAVVARSVVSQAAPGIATPYGGSLPAVPASSALASGEGQRFAGVDDASPATRQAHAPGTYRSSLILLETANSSAVVRVSLAYQFSGGGKATARAAATREYALGPSRYLVIDELATWVIGPDRSAIGDLRNMIVDVDVVGGAGRVIPFVVSYDNGSGDMHVRHR